MKLSSMLILVVLIASLFMSFSGHVAIAQSGSEHLLALDVCHGGGLFSFAHADIPCLYECSNSPSPLTFAGFVEVSYMSSTISSFFSPLEQPPKA